MTFQRKLNPFAGRRLMRGSFRSARRAAGFTLVELMIAMAIGLVLVAGLLMALNSTLGSSRTNDRTSELQSDGRHSLNLIKQELRQAGFRGYTSPPPNVASTALGAVAGECGDGTGVFASNIRQGVWGANDSNPFSGTCMPHKVGASGGDILVIRLMDGTPLDDAALAPNTFYFWSTYALGEVFRGTTPPGLPAAGFPAKNFALQTSVYHVLPYTVSPTETPPVPALHRVALRSDGSMARELVSSGIEQLQVQYGRVTATAATTTTQYFDTFTADNCTGCALDANGTASTETVWDEVNAVRIWVLSRSSTPEPGYTNTSSYVMGDQTVTVNDGFRRQLFSTVVQLRN